MTESTRYFEVGARKRVHKSVSGQSYEADNLDQIEGRRALTKALAKDLVEAGHGCRRCFPNGWVE